MMLSTLLSAAVAAAAPPVALPSSGVFAPPVAPAVRVAPSAPPRCPAPCAPAPAPAEDASGPCVFSEAVPDDVRALDDLQRIAERVRCDLELLRDVDFEDSLDVGFADREWLVQAVRERWEETRPAERVALEERTAKMLGMLPAGASLREEELRVLEQTVAFFDHDADRLYLLETGGEVSPFVVAAGLSAALNEQHLEQLWGPTDARLGAETDTRWVREAVLRGSNIALLLLWAVENLDKLPLQELAEMQRAHPSLDDSPPYVWKPMLGLTLRGESFLRRSTLSGWISPPRLSDMDRALVDVPLSTEQILHPDKYWTTRRRDDPALLRFDSDELPGAWTVAYEDTLGEMILSVLIQPFEERRGVDPSLFSRANVDFTSDLTAGWGGDRVALLESEDGTIVHLVTLWDRPADAAEFLAAVEGQREGMLENLALLSREHGLRVGRGGQDEVTVTSWIGVDEGRVDRVLRGLSELR